MKEFFCQDFGMYFEVILRKIVEGSSQNKSYVILKDQNLRRIVEALL